MGGEGGRRVLGRGQLTVSGKKEKMRARSCKVIVKFEVRKEGVNSEVLWGTQEDS